MRKMGGDPLQHHFDVEIAVRYGITEAILLNHFEYWIELNRANEKNYFEGRYWTFNSMKAFLEIFPYLTEKKIRNALKHLQDEGLILTGNFNKLAYDRTLWYSFSDLAESILPKGQMDFAKRANGFCQKGRPIPDNNPNNKTDNDHDYDLHDLSFLKFKKNLKNESLKELNEIILKGAEKDLFLYAIDKAKEYGKENVWPYIREIVKGYMEVGIYTAEKAREDDQRKKEWKESKKQKQKSDIYVPKDVIERLRGNLN